MDICRAFDLFEMICLVVTIVSLLIAFLLLVFIWTKEIKEIKKEFARWKAVRLIIMVLIWMGIFLAYEYIKSMFC